MVEETKLFDDRETLEYIAHSHNTRVESLGDWKDRTEKNRSMAKGEISYKNPDGVEVRGDLQITNLADAMPKDTARLTSEVEPNYRAKILGKTDKDNRNAEVRQVVAKNYFEMNRFDVLRPYLSIDLDIAGACFVCAWIDPGFPIPRIERVDPLFAYPMVYNGKLVDLLVIQQMNVMVARMMFPYDMQSDIFDRMQPTDDVTIMDYYGPGLNAKAIGRAGSEGARSLDPGKILIVNKTKTGFMQPTVGFAMLPTVTGEFAGSVDQIAAPMATKNRLVNLITENAHEAIYAPWEERGILNWQEDPGPDTKYHHNTAIDGETYMRRIAPATFNGELFGLLTFLEQEQRGQLGYPTTRQGDVGVSQGSASYLSASQGQLQSIVRERQRLLAGVQEDLISASMQLERHFLNFEKPLPTTVGNQSTYIPTDDLTDTYVRVEYGAGAGLDRINADQRLINFYTVGVLSGEMVLEQSDFVDDPRGEMERRQNEEIDRILLEKWLATPEVTPEIIGMTLKYKRDKGVSLNEAWAEVQHQIAEAQAEAQAAMQEVSAAPTPTAAPPAGAESTAPQPQPEFAKTPLHQVISSNQR